MGIQASPYAQIMSRMIALILLQRHMNGMPNALIPPDCRYVSAHILYPDWPVQEIRNTITISRIYYPDVRRLQPSDKHSDCPNRPGRSHRSGRIGCDKNESISTTY